MKKKKFIIKIFLLASLYAFAQEKTKPEKVEEIVAIIGDKMISKRDLMGSIALNKDKNSNFCGELEKILLNEILFYSIKKKIFNTKDKSDKEKMEKIKISAEEEAENSIKNIPKDQIPLLLRQYNFQTLGQLREKIIEKKMEFYYMQAYRAELMKKNDITPKEVENFYNKIKSKFGNVEDQNVEEQVEFREIIFYPQIKEAHKKEIFSRLYTLKEKIEKGESFHDLAILHSQDPSSNFDGGLIKGVKKGQMDKKFESEAFLLEEGEISKPFESAFGFHIIKLEKRKGREIDLRHILIMPEFKEDELKEAENFANSIREELIEGKITFSKLIQDYGEGSDSKKLREIPFKVEIRSTKKVEKNDLPIETSLALTALEEGEFTYPYKTQTEREGKIAFSIARLDKIIPSHKLNLQEDYALISNYAKEEEMGKKHEKSLLEAIKNTYIKIAREYQNCEFYQLWLRKNLF